MVFFQICGVETKSNNREVRGTVACKACVGFYERWKRNRRVPECSDGSYRCLEQKSAVENGVGIKVSTGVTFRFQCPGCRYQRCVEILTINKNSKQIVRTNSKPASPTFDSGRSQSLVAIPDMLKESSLNLNEMIYNVTEAAREFQTSFNNITFRTEHLNCDVWSLDIGGYFEQIFGDIWRIRTLNMKKFIERALPSKSFFVIFYFKFPSFFNYRF